MYYIRNLKESKWSDKKKWSMYTFEDLHTTECQLSVWATTKIEEKDLLDMALAIAMTKDWLCDVWLCLIPTQILKCYKFRIKKSEGETKYKKFANRHVNIILPQMQDLQQLYSYFYRHWTIRKKGESTGKYIRWYSRTRLEQKFFNMVDNGEFDDLIKEIIQKKDEKSYKNYYKKLKTNQRVQTIEADMNQVNNINL